MTTTTELPLLAELNAAFGFHFEPDYPMPERERTALAEFALARGRADLATRLLREEINPPLEAA